MHLPVIALLLADSRTPTGTYAHSGGLEAAVERGLTANDVPGFMRGRLRSVAFVDAALAAAAARACSAGERGVLALLDAEAQARIPSPALRAASSLLGRTLLRTAATIWPGDALIAHYRDTSDATPRGVALGVVANAAGIDPAGAALLALYEDCAGVASAAVKLLPVDAADAASWLADLGPEMHALAGEAAVARDPAELPSTSAPLLDIRSLAHQTKEGKLFVS